MKIFRQEQFGGGVLYDTSTLAFLVVPKLTERVDKIIPIGSMAARGDILSSPVRVYFELTQKCNLACRHCFVSATKKAYAGLATKKIFRILDDLKQARVLDVRFTGGEVTTRKDWYEILDYAKKLGFSVSLNTNGVFPDQNETIEKIASLNLEQVTVSIDGIGRTHDLVRGNGSFNKSMTAVKSLAQKGVVLRFNTVLRKSNLSSLPSVIELAAKYATEINFFYMRPIGRALRLENELLSYLEHKKSESVLLSYRNRFPDLNVMGFEMPITDRTISPDISNSTGLRELLPFGSTTINVSADGSLWPHGYCTYQWDELSYGNLNRDSLLDVWQNSKKLENMRNWGNQLIKRCLKCLEYRETCPGFSFEMEIARQIGQIDSNPFCISSQPVPVLNVEK